MRRLPAVAVALTASLLIAASPGATSSPEFRDRQWALDDINAEAAQEITAGKGATVAVIDTGIDVGHPEFAGRIVSPISFVCPDGVPVPCEGAQYVQDGHGHGTHVAGTIAAAGIGVLGVAPEANIMPVRVFDDEGGYDTGGADFGDVIRAAADRGADVINMSLGYIAGTAVVWNNPVIPLDEEEAQAIREVAARGVLVVISAGNDSLPYCGNSEFYQDAGLCVGATGQTEAFYTNWGYNVDVLAPGGDVVTQCGILSTHPRGVQRTAGLLSLVTGRDCSMPDGYAHMSGTSMAAPHAAGVAALLASMGVTGATARQIIIDTARGAGSPALVAGQAGPELDALAAVQAGAELVGWDPDNGNGKGNRGRSEDRRQDGDRRGGPPEGRPGPPGHAPRGAWAGALVL